MPQLSGDANLLRETLGCPLELRRVPDDFDGNVTAVPIVARPVNDRTASLAEHICHNQSECPKRGVGPQVLECHGVACSHEGHGRRAVSNGDSAAGIPDTDSYTRLLPAVASRLFATPDAAHATVTARKHRSRGRLRERFVALHLPCCQVDGVTARHVRPARVHFDVAWHPRRSSSE